MGEIALAGAIALIDKFVLVHQNVSHNAVHHDVEVVRKLLSTLKGYLKDTEGRENTEGSKDRIEIVRDLAYEIEDAIDKYMYDVPEHVHHHWFTKFLHDAAHPVANHCLSSTKFLHDAIKATDAFRVCPSDVASSSMAGEIPLEAYPISLDDHLVGIERRGEGLLHLIRTNESKEVVISVFGAAGSGKTTFIHEVYKMVKENFECHAWVPVPRSGEGLLEKIYEALELPVYQEINRRERLHSYLQQKRYILILDGIWIEDEWDRIKTLVPRSNKYSRIIISTRNRNLASYCATSHDYIHDLKSLTWEEAWELFCKKAFRNGKCPKHLFDWSEKIVKRCELLPHAIVTVGTFLSNRSHDVSEFKNFHDSLEYKPRNLVCRSYLQSYHHLAPNFKSCFLYFCNFPEDRSVTRGRLVRLWIGEGFIEKKAGCKTLEQVADEYLDELVQMSLSNKDNFFTVLKSSDSHTSLGEKTRRLSFHDCSPIIQRKGDFSQVQVVKLILLRYLSLRNSKIDSVPKSIKKLQNLMILDLRQTSVNTLPKEIYELHELLYLLVGLPDKDKNHAAVGAEVSPGIGRLKLLQKLSLIKAINKKKGSIVEELGKLTELRKLGITELKEEDGKGLYASIEKMQHLSSLYVKSSSRDEYLDLNYVGNFPPMIKSLFLGGRLHNMIPGWIRSLNEELHLHDAYSGEELVFETEWFVELRMLEIEQFSQLCMVVIRETAMPKLQKLTITNCDCLKMVCISNNILDRLEERHIPKDVETVVY
uniref:NB-ARC domain-containing protein n=1 Tax=Fagus sylvatica TaxID=28930 RepID=A0A2N9G2E8_FAGSY